MPSLRDRDTHAVALAGATIAIVTTPLLPAGLPVLLALADLVILALPHRVERSEPPARTPVIRRAGVLVGTVLAGRRAPFVAVVAAAATAAVPRLLGVPCR